MAGLVPAIHVFRLAMIQKDVDARHDAGDDRAKNAGGIVMAYWLLKTEPEEFSWDDQVKSGAKGEAWTGVRNFTARRHLQEMKKGEKFFFYHTGDAKQVVGIGKVIRDAYPDPSA